MLLPSLLAPTLRDVHDLRGQRRWSTRKRQLTPAVLDTRASSRLTKIGPEWLHEFTPYDWVCPRGLLSWRGRRVRRKRARKWAIAHAIADFWTVTHRASAGLYPSKESRRNQKPENDPSARPYSESRTVSRSRRKSCVRRTSQCPKDVCEKRSRNAPRTQTMLNNHLTKGERSKGSICSWDSGPSSQ